HDLGCPGVGGSPRKSVGAYPAPERGGGPWVSRNRVGRSASDPSTDSGPDLRRHAEAALDIVIEPKHQHLTSKRDSGDISHGGLVCEPDHVGLLSPRKRPIAHPLPFEPNVRNVLKVTSYGTPVKNQESDRGVSKQKAERVPG